MDIESTDIIRLIEQFLKEQKLHKTLETLQSETGVKLNTVDSIDAFKSDIIKGHWDAVLTNVEHANIPQDKLIDLYEHIIIELVELQDLGPARALLRQTEPMELLRSSQPERYIVLEQLLSRTTFDPSTAFKGKGGKEARRLRIAQELAGLVSTAPANRLLELLGQAIKWQTERQGLVVADGAPYDLFYGKAVQPLMPSEDKMPDTQLATVKFPKKQHPTSLAFSPSNEYLATGSADGFIEVWNFMTGRLAHDLKYQTDGALMMMEGAVITLAFSHSGDLICSGAADGKLQVWKVKSGTSYRRFPAAHSQDISCVCFSFDDTQVLSGSLDGILRIHGLKSGNMLKEFRGHSAAVTGAVFSQDMSLVVSTSEDGSVRIWDAGSAACIYSVVPGAGVDGLIVPATHGVLRIPGSPSSFVVCTKSPTMYIVSAQGKVERTLAPKDESLCKEFVTAAITPQGKYVLAVSDSSVMHCFCVESGEQMGGGHKVSDAEIIGMANHPKLNVAAFFGQDRRVPIWSGF
ncbi:hypothetical protein GGF37_000174 [Kickxella alabastrina]|nr:hypothetical protein GGF37_000174 [Kickxella alabastrina]